MVAVTGILDAGNFVLPELSYSGTWMGERFVTVSVKSPYPIDWQIGDYLIYRGEKFVLNYDPTVVKKSRKGTSGEGFVYDGVKFNSLSCECGDVRFLDEVLQDSHIHYTSLSSFTFFAATADDLADRLQANMNRYCSANGFSVSDWWLILTPSLERSRSRAIASGGSALAEEAVSRWNEFYTDGVSVDGERFNQNVSVSDISVLDGFALLYNLFGLHFITSGRTLAAGTSGKIAEHIFEYGKGKGLYELEKVADGNQAIVTKLFAYGNSTNLPVRYYARLNKTCFAKVRSVETGGTSFVIDIPFASSYYNGSKNPSVALDSFQVTFLYGGKQYTCYVSSDRGYPVSKQDGYSYLSAFIGGIPSLSVGDTITFVSGIDDDKWPSGHFSYVNDGSVLPDNLAISHLMLPGFPSESLRSWVMRNGGVEKGEGLIEWRGYEAYFSEDPLSPYVQSANAKKLGVRESSLVFDGSNGTDDIHPTITGSGKDVVVRCDMIADNGIFGEGEEAPNFHLVIPSLGEDVSLDILLRSDAKISMKDGYCGGMEFNIESVNVVEDGWELTLNRAYDDALQLYFPYSFGASLGNEPSSSESYQIRKGDTFVLLGIELPSSYIGMASERLLEGALQSLSGNDYTRHTYVPRVDEIYMARQHDAVVRGVDELQYGTVSLHDTLREGDLMRFEDADLSVGGTIFIDQLQIKEYGNKQIPTYDVTLRESKSVGTIERIQQEIDALSQNKSGGSGGGVSTSQVKSILNMYGDKRYIRRDIDDETDTTLGAKQFVAKEKMEFGSKGNFVQGVKGSKIWKDDDGNWHYEGDFVHVRKKFTAKEVQIEDVHHIGGQQILSAANMRADFVVRKDGFWRCFFLKVDSDGRNVENRWRKQDQAFVNTFNITKNSDGFMGNHYLWRLVVNTSNDIADNSSYTIGGVVFNASEYHFVDLSEEVCGVGSDAPMAGDDIVQLGHRGSDKDRQNAIILAGAGSGSPYIIELTGITDFSLPESDTQIKPGDNRFTGKVHLRAGSEIDDGVVSVGRSNLLMNTGFRGQYVARNLEKEDALDENSEMWSPSLEGWSFTDASVINDNESMSTKACKLSAGTLTQTLVFPIKVGLDCYFSFKAKGTTVMFSCGGYSETIPLSGTYQTYRCKFRTENKAATFALAGTATLCELFLECGNVPSTSWEPSPYDNNSSLDKIESLRYLSDAIREGSTTILGGLVLSNIIEVGNYVDGVMKEVTGGISGVYNNKDNVAFFAGGTLEKAVRAVNMFKRNPHYVPTDEEWDAVANAVITHGGRAILNDIILRGSVYAESGYFKGELIGAYGVFDGYVKENYVKIKDSDAVYKEEGGYYELGKQINLELERGDVYGTSASIVHMPSDVSYIGSRAKFYEGSYGLETRSPGNSPLIYSENGIEGVSYLSKANGLLLPTHIQFAGGFLEFVGVKGKNMEGKDICKWVLVNSVCYSAMAYTVYTDTENVERKSYQSMELRSHGASVYYGGYVAGMECHDSNGTLGKLSVTPDFSEMSCGEAFIRVYKNGRITAYNGVKENVIVDKREGEI